MYNLYSRLLRSWDYENLCTPPAPTEEHRGWLSERLQHFRRFLENYLLSYHLVFLLTRWRGSHFDLPMHGCFWAELFSITTFSVMANSLQSHDGFLLRWCFNHAHSAHLDLWACVFNSESPSCCFWQVDGVVRNPPGCIICLHKETLMFLCVWAAVNPLFVV